MNRPYRFQFNQPERPFYHSHIMAQSKRGKQLGTGSPHPFSRRRQTDIRRQHVDRYRYSHLAYNRYRNNNIDTAALQRQSDEAAAEQSESKDSKQEINSRKGVQSPAPRTGFQEPGGRGYNPYS